jgi:hypothetical protein
MCPADLNGAFAADPLGWHTVGRGTAECTWLCSGATTLLRSDESFNDTVLCRCGVGWQGLGSNCICREATSPGRASLAVHGGDGVIRARRTPRETAVPNHMPGSRAVFVECARARLDAT